MREKTSRELKGSKAEVGEAEEKKEVERNSRLENQNRKISEIRGKEENFFRLLLRKNSHTVRCRDVD